MIVSSKDQESQLPSYSGDGFDYGHNKEQPSDSPTPVPSTSVPPPNFSTATSSSSPHYAPSPAPFSLSSAITTHSSTTPLSFSRPRLQGPNFSYAPFKPIFLLAASEKSTSLSKGFPMTPPPAKESDEPHPFVTHDVNEIDWLQFLTDVQAAGSLNEKDIQRSHLPIISWVPFIGGLSAYGIQKIMKSRKYTSVARTLDIWNHHFFEPRKIRIVLMRGNERLSGLDRGIEDLHTPEPVNVSSGIMEQAVGRPGSGNDRKGKGKSNEGDGVYRLFVLSI